MSNFGLGGLIGGDQLGYFEANRGAFSRLTFDLQGKFLAIEDFQPLADIPDAYTGIIDPMPLSLRNAHSVIHDFDAPTAGLPPSVEDDGPTYVFVTDAMTNGVFADRL